MARYIDVDKLIEKMKSHCSAAMCIVEVTRQPTADVVEVVRCKDCKCYIPDSELDHNEYPNPLEADGLCENIDKYTDETDFCSYGERRDT